MKRLYILEYDFYPSYSGKYGNTSSESRQEIFQFSERQQFIERYKKLVEDNYYSNFDNIKTYYVDYGSFEITDKMNDIIRAI